METNCVSVPLLLDSGCGRQRSQSGGYVGLISETFGTNPTYVGTSGFPVLVDWSRHGFYVGSLHMALLFRGLEPQVIVNVTSINEVYNYHTEGWDNTRIRWDINGVEGARADYSQYLDDYPVIPIRQQLTPP